MYLLGLGLILLAMKYLGYEPVSNWSWLIVLAPLGLAVLWWAWADATGYTSKKSMERELQRKEKRIAKQREALGMGPERKKKR